MEAQSKRDRTARARDIFLHHYEIAKMDTKALSKVSSVTFLEKQTVFQVDVIIPITYAK